ncbi:hypothetical protein H4S04_009330, partial [Coemansia sp. S16]
GAYGCIRIPQGRIASHSREGVLLDSAPVSRAVFGNEAIARTRWPRPAQGHVQKARRSKAMSRR